MSSASSLLTVLSHNTKFVLPFSFLIVGLIFSHTENKGMETQNYTFTWIPTFMAWASSLVGMELSFGIESLVANFLSISVFFFLRKGIAGH